MPPSTKNARDSSNYRLRKTNDDTKMPARLFKAHGTSYPIPPSQGPTSHEVGDALPELGPTNAKGSYRHRVDHHQNQTHVDTDVLKALTRETAVRQPTLNPSDETLHHRPQPLVDQPLVLRTLHVDAILHRENVRRIHPSFHTPPSDERSHPAGPQSLEHPAGLEAAVAGEELHLDVLPQNLVEQRLHEEALVHVGGGFDVSEGEALDVGEEDGAIA
jgi:hypothetical protein